MAQSRPSSNGALWALPLFRRRLALDLSPSARSTHDSYLLPCRQDLVSPPERTQRPLLGRDDPAMVSHGAARARRPTRFLAACGAQRLRHGVARCRHRGAACPAIPRAPTLELSTALQQSRRFGEGRSFAWAPSLLFHSSEVHAGSWLVPQVEASVKGKPRRRARAGARISKWSAHWRATKSRAASGCFASSKGRKLPASWNTC